MRRMTGAVLMAVVLAVGAAGCGDDEKDAAPSASSSTSPAAPTSKSADRPSAAVLAKTFSDADSTEPVNGIDPFPPEAAQCIGEKLFESNLSDEVLKNLVEKGAEFEPSDEDTAIFGKLLPQLASCNPVTQISPSS